MNWKKDDVGYWVNTDDPEFKVQEMCVVEWESKHGSCVLTQEGKSIETGQRCIIEVLARTHNIALLQALLVINKQLQEESEAISFVIAELMKKHKSLTQKLMAL